VLANLFMHYAFDMWMAREYPGRIDHGSELMAGER
jgi:hypothetical protein